MEALILRLKHQYPQFKFSVSGTPRWSPHTKEVRYSIGQPHSIDGLLHELAHAILEHTKFVTDIDLLDKEVNAWDKARVLASLYSVSLDEEHIQNCLDTYRDWLYRRSRCPRCSLSGLQDASRNYKCINCGHMWSVSKTRFCRPYRRSQNKIASG